MCGYRTSTPPNASPQHSPGTHLPPWNWWWLGSSARILESPVLRVRGVPINQLSQTTVELTSHRLQPVDFQEYTAVSRRATGGGSIADVTLTDLIRWNPVGVTSWLVRGPAANGAWRPPAPVNRISGITWCPGIGDYARWRSRNRDYLQVSYPRNWLVAEWPRVCFLWSVLPSWRCVLWRSLWKSSLSSWRIWMVRGKGGLIRCRTGEMGFRVELAWLMCCSVPRDMGQRGNEVLGGLDELECLNMFFMR